MPEQALEFVSSSIQGAHLVAEQIPVPQLSELIIDTADAAFVAGMTQAMLLGSFIIGAAALLTFAILPTRIQRVDELPGDVLPEDDQLPDEQLAEDALPEPSPTSAAD